ncbi:UvrD-helicase domain-containing protein [Enterococcus faecium]
MTNIFEKIVNDLNLEQKDVVESEDNLYVNACPGSGKTRVLTRKIAYQESSPQSCVKVQPHQKHNVLRCEPNCHAFLSEERGQEQ